MTDRGKRWWWLLEPFTERWVIRYTLLAFVGTPLLLTGYFARVGWLLMVGVALWVPFVLWFVTFFLVVLPGALLVVWYTGSQSVSLTQSSSPQGGVRE